LHLCFPLTDAYHRASATKANLTVQVRFGRHSGAAAVDKEQAATDVSKIPDNFATGGCVLRVEIRASANLLVDSQWNVKVRQSRARCSTFAFRWMACTPTAGAAGTQWRHALPARQCAPSSPLCAAAQVADFNLSRQVEINATASTVVMTNPRCGQSSADHVVLMLGWKRSLHVYVLQPSGLPTCADGSPKGPMPNRHAILVD